jgi:HlyD family secretion protein
MKKQQWIGIGAGLLALLAIAGWYSSRGEAYSKDILVSPRKGKFEMLVATTGELQAKRSVEIYGPRGAQKAQIYQLKISNIVDEGTVVSKGQYVAQIDQSDLMSKLAEREIDLQKAQSQYTQAKLDTALTLSEARNAIVNLRFTMKEKQYEMQQSAFEAPATQQHVQLEYEKAERALEQAVSNYQKRIAQAVAKVKEVESELNKHRNNYNELTELRTAFTITAPENGMVIYYRDWDGRKRTTGSMVQVWNPVVATLPDLTEMESITYVNEIDIQKISTDQAVTIGLDAMADKKLTGKVTSVANIGEQRPNSDSKVFEVHISISESDTTLRPAMTTSNEILVTSIEQALSLPIECLHAVDTISFVYKKVGGKIVRQEIMAGLMNENDAQIIRGIEETDKIFLSVPEDTTGLAWLRLGEETKEEVADSN